MTVALKNHPGMWLEDNAGNAFNAMEDKYGPIVVNRAGVTIAQQQEEINRWNAGGPENRPPYLYMPAMPASSSNHVKGYAVDVYNYTDDRAKLNEFGFEWYGSADPVHYTFTGVPANTPSGDYNPFGILYCAGLQKIANLYGAGTNIDQKWGEKSAYGFARFLRANWGYTDDDDILGPNMWAAIARWLRARWGYVGDDTPGPVMRAALQRAETANYNEL